MTGSESTAPAAFTDRTLERYLSLSLPVRLYILATSFGGIAAAVIYIFGLLPLLDLTYYFLLMAMYLPVAYLLLPAHKKETRVGWLSYGPAVAALAVTLFLASKGRTLAFQSWIPANEWQLAIAVAVFLLVMEAARRAGGLIFTGIVGFFALYPVFAEYMPGMLWGPPTSLSRTVASTSTPATRCSASSPGSSAKRSSDS
jgi:TRAP-type uncharacterized transport system fused permease subunit